MIHEITMPQLGESVTEGTLERWLVQEGDEVKKYDPLAEVTTDKVNAEIPSSFEGKIISLIAEAGDTLAVGTVVCTIEVSEEKEQTTPTISPTLANVSRPEQASQQRVKETVIKSESLQQAGRFSPAVLALAAKHQISLEKVKGTGIGGRITRKDVEQYIENPQIAQEEKEINKTATVRSETSEQIPTQNEVQEELAALAEDREIPIAGVRRAIATNMKKSVDEIPHAWMMIEVDVTNLVAYRDRIKNTFKEEEGFSITYFAFFIKAVARALRQFPMLNSQWAGDKIIQKKDIHISIAVATEDALYVPVIRHADEKSIKGIARDIHEYAQLTRAGKLKLDHLKGGTFTVNNTGTFGSVQSAGIINHPQAAILQIEKIVKRPVVVQNNMIAIRDMVNICLSLDHRVLDGYICGKFLQYVKNILENDDFTKMSVY